MPNLSRSLRPWPVLAAVLGTLAMTALAYLPGLSGGFMFDDLPNIVLNPAFPVTSLAPHSLLNVMFSSRSGILYRPLSMLSFALDNYFFGGGPYPFKLTNVLIHVANAAMIYWLCRRLLLICRRRYGFGWSDRALAWASVLTAAAWALHPLNLTAVLYIVQRMTSLAAFFTLAGMLSYLYGRERSLAGKTGWPLVWILTPFFGAVGVLCKEDAALLPLYLLIIEWLLFGFRRSDTHTSKNILSFYILGLVLPGLIGVAWLVHRHFWTGYAGRDFTLPERVLTEFRVVFLYVKWTFIPDIREFALYHDDLAISTGLLHPVTTLLSLLALLTILAVAFWQRRRRPLLCLGILWFFAGQMMESTVLPLELVFEHRNYLPDFGLILAFFSLLLLPAAQTRGTRIGLLRRQVPVPGFLKEHDSASPPADAAASAPDPPAKPSVRPALRWTVAVLILPVLFGVTFLRSWEWRNPLSFAYYEAHHHPDSQRAVYALAQAYSNLALQGDLQNPELAIRTLERAGSLSSSIMPEVALMIVAAKLKLPVQPAWAERTQQLLRSRPFTPQDANSLFHLVACLPTSCGHLAEPAGAILEAALHRSAEDSGAYRNPDLWAIYAQYLTFTGRPLDEVLFAMRRSVSLAPKVAQYHINLARGLIVAGDYAGTEQQIAALRKLNFLGHLDVDIAKLEKRLAHARAGSGKPGQEPSQALVRPTT